MKFIITVNPHGGTKKGPQILKKVKPIFEASGDELFIIETTFAGHAKELANQLDITNYDGFIGIGGIQRFLLGQIGMGILYLLTWGLCGIGTIIDLINYKKLTLERNQEIIVQEVLPML